MAERMTTSSSWGDRGPLTDAKKGTFGCRAKNVSKESLQGDPTGLLARLSKAVPEATKGRTVPPVPVVSAGARFGLPERFGHYLLFLTDRRRFVLA